MPIPPVVAAAIIGGGASVGSALINRSPRAAVPKDLQGFRSEQINLLRSLLQPGAFGAGGAGERFFGQLGMPQSDLQRQSAGGISQFLNQPSPETRTFDFVRPLLEGMLTGTGPQFERDIAGANQQGGRFGSANAILRGEALRNLFNQRTQTAGTLGMLAGQSGQADFGRLLQGFGVGQQQAQQGDIGTQRLLQILMTLLGTGQQATLGLPIQQGQDPLGALGGAGMNIATLIALLTGRQQGPGGAGGTGGRAPGQPVPGGSPFG